MTSNKETNDFIKIVECLKDPGLLSKAVSFFLLFYGQMKK